MLTSFAPSPIASVVSSLFLALTIVTTSAFYLGDTLQAITTLAAYASSKNSSLTILFLHILSNESPDTITAFYLANSVSF